MIPRRLLAAAALFAAAGAATAQLVPVSRCQAAIPCSVPFGIRPVESLQHSPYARQGQGAGVSVSAGIEEGLKPKVDVRRVSDDPSETAARIFVKKNPPPTPTPGPARSPGARPS